MLPRAARLQVTTLNPVLKQKNETVRPFVDSFAWEPSRYALAK
jgi:hypothetical protein